MAGPMTPERRARLDKAVARAQEAAATETPEQAALRKDLQDYLVIEKAHHESNGFDWHDPVTQQELAMVEFLAKKSLSRHLDEIKALKKEVKALKEAAGHVEKHFVTFGGEFQIDRPYYENTIVMFKALPYIAGRDIAEGKADPPRQGSGWIKLF